MGSIANQPLELPAAHIEPPLPITIGDPEKGDRRPPNCARGVARGVATTGNLKPLEYARKVLDHSQTSISDSLFSGQEYGNLAQFLWTPYLLSSGRSSPRHSRPEPADGFAWLYELRPEVPPVGRQLSLPLPRLKRNDSVDCNCLLFLRGYPSAEWILELGSRYKIDPEFFHRHMHYLSDSQDAARRTPFMLPSSQKTIFQMSVTSVGTQTNSTYADVKSKRAAAACEMDTYLHSLRARQGWRCGNSIVRSYEVHDEKHFSIEQTVTVHVASIDKTTDRWIAVIWLDGGDDLSRSPRGPWLDPPGVSFNTYFRPVTLYKPNISFKDHQVVTKAGRGEKSFEAAAELPQSVSLLPIHYGKSLNMSAMSSDPFYALTELFAFVSASEIEVLNIIALKLDESMTGTPDLDPDTAIHVQASLVHYQRVLEDHAHRICETLTFVKNRTSLKWARSQASKAITAAARLEHDFEYILDRTRQLQQRCQRELTIMMNNANIGEARRGIEQGKRVFKFTLLAFTYVPLSFSCSIFGMNFVQFSERGRGYLIWALVSLPLFLVSLLIILWDGPKLRKRTKRIFGTF